MIVQIRRHVLDIVYASSQLSSLSEVVDTDKKRLAITRAIGILETVARWSSMTESLHRLRGWWRGIGITMCIGVGVYRGHG